MNTAEILRAAAARVRQGWCQGRYGDGAGGVCAIGALYAGNGHGFRGDPIAMNDAIAIVNAYHYARTRLNVESLSQWNDAPDQTAENVATGLEYAALVWEQEQAHATPASPVKTEEHAQ